MRGVTGREGLASATRLTSSRLARGGWAKRLLLLTLLKIIEEDCRLDLFAYASGTPSFVMPVNSCFFSGFSTARLSDFWENSPSRHREFSTGIILALTQCEGEHAA